MLIILRFGEGSCEYGSAEPGEKAHHNDAVNNRCRCEEVPLGISRADTTGEGEKFYTYGVLRVVVEEEKRGHEAVPSA